MYQRLEGAYYACNYKKIHECKYVGIGFQMLKAHKLFGVKR